MILDIEYSLPFNIFSSANQYNNFESLSEQISSNVILTYLNKEKNELSSGNADIKEPDYVWNKTADINDKGFDVTWAVDESVILEIKGISDLSSQNFDIENRLKNNISKSIQKKVRKKYIINNNKKPEIDIVVFAFDPFIEWYMELIDNELSNDLNPAFINSRNCFFDGLYKRYLKTNIFNNIIIIQPSLDQNLIVFDIKKFGMSNEEFITKIGIIEEKLQAYPNCKIRNKIKLYPNLIYNFSVIKI